MKCLLLITLLLVCINIQNTGANSAKIDRCPIPIYTSEDYERMILHELKRREGLRTNRYVCPAGYSTIGYGHVGKTIKPIKTKKDAEDQLLYDLKRYVKKVETIYNGVQLSYNEKLALASLYMNLKYNKLKGSGLERRIKTGRNPYKYWIQYTKYTTKSGITRSSKNLVRAREFEIYLFNINKTLKNERSQRNHTFSSRP